jgi:hypothetical protein
MSARISDYKCPGCRRIRRRMGMSPTIVAQCGCSDVPQTMGRISWSKVNWRKVSRVIAEELDVSLPVVSAKRRELGKDRGKIGRKPRNDLPVNRKVNPADIDLALTSAENWRILQAKGIHVSQQRIRQIKARLMSLNDKIHP